MEITSQFPSWFVYIIAIALVVVGSAFFRVLWSRYVMLEAEVDALRERIVLCATHSDIQTLTAQIRLEYLSTQKRLDDIHALISKYQSKF